MLRRRLNLGILAHVDAGKTTLTERLLHAAGVIDEVGSVDKGTTQTDTLALERRRGITIKAAVASFALGDVVVNLVDTPGHPDFIAEVERSLGVLDGSVLVVSAVEGVQPQTRILMRALRRLRVPTLLFVNKVDRAGADEERVLREIGDRLTPAIVPLGSVREIGTRAAAFVPSALGAGGLAALAERDEALLAAFVEDERVPPERLREALAEQTAAAAVHPVLCGSALTGAGVEELQAAIVDFLPAAAGDAEGPLAGTVFKIERGDGGEKIAYVRLFSGTLRTRDRVRFGEDREAKVTALAVFDGGAAEGAPSASAGQIAKVWGLADVRIGDGLGVRAAPLEHHFAPPTLESVVAPREGDDAAALRAALVQLAEGDPLIDVRWDDERRELSVSLYGEVQKEVIEATLADDYGLDVEFRETTTICVERPAAAGEAVEILHAEGNPFPATIGLRVEPAAAGSGFAFELDVAARDVPLYAYGTRERFAESMERHVRSALEEGLHGWPVVDCAVTMTRCTYQSPDGPPSTRGSLTTPADFRKLAPIVLMEALADAGTAVCEPVLRVRVELPPTAIGAVLAALARFGGVAEAPALEGDLATIETLLPAPRVRELQRELPALTGGEGTLETEFAGYEPVTGAPPTRRRRTPNPLNRDEYLLHLARRV